MWAEVGVVLLKRRGRRALTSDGLRDCRVGCTTYATQSTNSYTYVQCVSSQRQRAGAQGVLSCKQGETGPSESQCVQALERLREIGPRAASSSRFRLLLCVGLASMRLLAYYVYCLLNATFR